ncbi:hypothetical protein [Marichromatium purpuratum]|uniref:hypothetical protein n=1 Tax=Marichromatium purpuratum TaxID=37487 RepID=UPI0012EBBA07|nr:hypothetical protein [Marichromatium purpuratum]
MFSNQGTINIQVKFKDFDGTVANQTMEPSEITQLISPDGGEFRKLMTFDDWPFEVYRYEIEPAKNTITIRAKKLKNQHAK